MSLEQELISLLPETYLYNIETVEAKDSDSNDGSALTAEFWVNGIFEEAAAWVFLKCVKTFNEIRMEICRNGLLH